MESQGLQNASPQIEPWCVLVTFISAPKGLSNVFVISAPVKESPTIYDAFRDKASRAEKPSGKEQVKPAEVTANGRKPNQRKKQGGSEKKASKVSLEAAAEKVSCSWLRECSVWTWKTHEYNDGMINVKVMCSYRKNKI